MPDYPRLLKLDEIAEQRLVAYLTSELSLHRGERQTFLDRLENEQKDYWAEPSTEVVDFPFQGAAVIIIPLQAITIEATHSRTMTTLFALNQFTAIRAKHADYVNVTRPLERALDHVLMNDIKVYNPLNDIILELEKHGTGIARVGYHKLVRTAIREVEKEDGTIEEEEFDVTVSDGPTVRAVPNSRFLMPFFYQTVEESPWVGEELTGAPHEIKALEESGYFIEGTFDKIYNSNNLPQNPTTVNQQELEGKQPAISSVTGPIKYVHIWLSFDVARSKDLIREYGDAGYTVPEGKDREIVVDFHEDTNTVMSIRYNWHSDLRRPYRKGVYFPVEHRWDGVGICKQLNQFQKEITTQHRQRLDNATVANVRMLKINKWAGYGPGEPIFPGKMWFVEKMDDVESMQLGEVYPSSYSNEHQTLQYAQQRSGVNELNLGMPQVGTPGTATAELSRVQESNKKFDFMYGNIRRLTSEIIVDVASELQQFGPKNLSYFEEVDGGNLVKKFLELPPTLISQGIIVDITAAGQKENKLLDRQNWQQVAQVLNQYYVQLIQLAMQVGDKEKAALIITHAYQGATEAMRQILESFDIKNIDRLIVQELLTNGFDKSQAGPDATQRALPSGPPNGIPQLNLPM